MRWMAWRVTREVVVCGLGLAGLLCPVQAHAGGLGTGTGARRRLAASSVHRAKDSAEVLVFGLGLSGCAAVCAVVSHWEERRRAARREDFSIAMVR